MHKDYSNAAVRQLRDQVVRYAPRAKKLEQIERAERLAAEIDTSRVYPYEFLAFRVTQFRPESHLDVRLSGEEALHDLRLFVEDVSESADVRADAVGERVLTVDDLSREFNVSTKTISRWRDQGLVGRRFDFDGRKRVGFLQSAVDRFVERNRERVLRGSRFSQLTRDEKEQIVERARRLVNAGGTPADVIRRVARHTGRSVETVRYTLKSFDQQHPDMAVFPEALGRLPEEVKRRMYQQHRLGTSVEALAKRYHRTKSSIYRIINEMRARRLLELPLDYIDNPIFHKPSAEKEILGPMKEADEAVRKARRPTGLPPYLASLYEVPLLTREQEVYLFRKMNYLKYKASKLRNQLDPANPRVSLMEEIEKLHEQIVATKNQIVRANLRLVVSIAKRHVDKSDNFFELVSDGNMSLIRAAEKFDFARGNKFSTYASWAIMKNFARTIPGESRHRDRYRTGNVEIFDSQEERRTNEFVMENTQRERETKIEKILSRLDEREQRIIMSRFGLAQGTEPQTLKEVGQNMGVTKERVRQIEARALSKLRQAAQEEHLEDLASQES